MKKYRIVITKNNEELTVQEIALVEEPAIEINWLYFNKEQKPLFFNEDKMVVAGPLMVPDKMIYRYDPEMGEYEVYFTKEDIENARYNLKKYGLTAEFNNEHTENKLDVVLLEDFIVEEGDTRTEKYGFTNLPVGTWFGISKIEDAYTWERIKKGELKGYSVEGLFKLKQEFKKVEEMVIDPTPTETKEDFISRCIATEIEAGYDEEQAAGICYTAWEENMETEEDFRKWRENADLYFESYTDYPKAATENAKIALRWVEENGWGDCGTPVGKARANQLAKGEPISRDTISRMASFERHRQNSQRELGDGCGRLMWLAWGGDEGIEWAQRKLEQIKNEKLQKLNNEVGTDIPTIKKQKIKMRKRIMKFVIETRLADGTEVVVEADELVVGAHVVVKVASEGDVAETDMYNLAPDGEHTLEDGTVITTEDGVITSIKPVEEEAEESITENEEEVEAKKKEKMEITEEDLVVIMEALQPKFEEITAMIAELAAKIAESTPEEEQVENFNKVKQGLEVVDKLEIIRQKFNLK